MSQKFVLHIVLLGFRLIMISNATELNSNETEAWEFAKRSDGNLYNTFSAVRNEFALGPELAFRKDDMELYFADLKEGAKQFDYKNFKDSELRYSFERIVNISEERGEPFYKISDIIDTIYELTREDIIKEYNSKSKHFLPYDPEVKRIIEQSSDPKELEYYWTKWREEIAYLSRNNLTAILKMLKDLPDVSPLLRNYNFSEIEKWMEEMNPLYMELHAFIRDFFHAKYGDSIVKSDGLIPHHLFEQVTAPGWSWPRIKEEMFPYDNLPEFKPYLYSKAIDMYKHAADRFYREIGFNPISAREWEDDIKMKAFEAGDCFAEIFNWTRGIYLKFCDDIDFEHLMQAYFGLARLYYAKEMIGLPSYFFDSQDLEFAIGKAMVLSASTYNNLRKLNMIASEFNLTQEVEMNRLLRMSVDNVLKIPVDFVHIKLIADLLLGNIELKDLNEKYWQLMEKYVGVGPPLNHKAAPEVFDMPVGFYELFKYVFTNQDSRKIDTEILSYQIYEKLCELSGKYPKEPLHLCDLNGSKAAGDALKGMMKLGASKPFNEVLATMFPENVKISTESIMEYYSPVKQILGEKNKKANVKLGWKHSQ